MSGGMGGDFPNITGSRCSRARAMHVNKLEGDRQRSAADDVPVACRPVPPRPAEGKESRPTVSKSQRLDQHQTTHVCLPAYTYIHFSCLCLLLT
jgi:hypothetical protein